MAADVQVKLDTPNSCCASLKNKYSKLEEKRNALRQAVKLLEQQIDKIQAESKKACERERARADFEKVEKEKESAARLVLENEVATLRSEIVSLKKEGVKEIGDGNGEVKILRARVSVGEKEINKLKEVVEKERKEAESVRKNAEAEKKKASEAQKIVEGERRKAEKERNVAKLEKEKAENFRLQVEAMRKEADEMKSKLVSEAVRLEVVNTKLEGEKQKVAKERKRADSEKAKAEEQRKLVEANRSKILDGKIYAEGLSRQLEESKRKIDELQKEIHELKSSSNLCKASVGQLDASINTEDKTLVKGSHESKFVLELSSKIEEANKRFQSEKQKASREKERADREKLNSEQHKKLSEMNRKKALEEKSRADQLCKQLEEEKQKVLELQKHIHELRSGRKSVAPSAVSMTESRELNFLKKQLKFQKMKKKHAKQVLELERSRNCILQQELRHIKLDFDQFSCRLDMLHKSFSGRKGVHSIEKTGNIIKALKSGSESFQIYLQKQNEPFKSIFPAVDPSGTVQQTLPLSAHLSTVPGANFVEPIAGIDSKLESLLGGSTTTMLTSSAINSNTTSFSDGQLVGSQDKSSFSVTTSAKLVEGHSQPILSDLSGEVTKIKSGENLAVVAENNVKSSVSNGDVGGVTVHGKKRKRMLEAVETIENLYFEEKKLHLRLEEKLSVLHGIIKKKSDSPSRGGKSLLPSFNGNSYGKHGKQNKKRKTSFQDKVVMQHACDIDEQKERVVVETEVHGNASFGKRTSLIGIDQVATFGAKGEGKSDSAKCDFDAVVGFEDLVDGNYINLLNLDSAADEECYRLAMEMPLSPIHHEIDIELADTLNVDNTITLANEPLRLNEEKKMLPSCRIDTNDMEVGINNTSSDGSSTATSSLGHNNENHVSTIGMVRNDWHTSEVGKAPSCLSSDFGVESTNPTILQDEKSKFQFGGESWSATKNILERCVVFSKIQDQSCFSRIQYTIRTCIGQCSLATKTEWMMGEILLALKIEEKLSSKEKVCALFSLLMINFSVTASGKFGNFINWASISCLDSFAGHVISVMSDMEVRRLFAELGCLDELFSLIENFLMDECAKVYDDLSFEFPVKCDSRVQSSLDVSDRSLFPVPASAELLVAGSIILASICAAVDRIGFICETSYSILRARRLNNSLKLSILHIFAYLGGDQFFSLSDYSLMMTVLKSLVRDIERLGSSDASDSCNSLMIDTRSAICPCVKCPFSGDVMSVETVTSFLLGKLKADDLLETKYNTPDFQSDPFSNVALYSLNDLLSLVELVAYHMGWEWTCLKIVPQLVKVLESCVYKKSTSEVVVLLGQLGRLGVEASGYEDKGVDQLRHDLSSFFRGGISIMAGLPIQIATVTAALGILSIDFKTIIETKEKFSGTASESILVDMIRKWFFLLSRRQQDLSFSILQTSGVNK
ncbi:hypothetical protein CsatB_001629 [Cannabis sativa]